MNSLILSLGSNQGNRTTILQRAITSITEKIGKVIAISNIYESDPIGFTSDDRFLNLCLSIETVLEPDTILKIIQEIEKENGRIRIPDGGYSSRPLDIDIVFFNDIVYKSTNLTIPHPHYKERLFVLIPLVDISKDTMDPENFLTMGQLAANCQDKSILTKFQFTFKC